MIKVVTDCYNFDRKHTGAADLVDVVQVSILQAGLTNGTAWEQVEAFAKLGIDTDVDMVELANNKQVIEETKQALMC